MTPEAYDGPMWNWFELTYSSYLVIPRALLCGMPLAWQEKMVALLNECREVYDTDQMRDRYTVKLRDERGRFVRDELANYRHPQALPYRQMKLPTDKP